MKLLVPKGTTSLILPVFIPANNVTTGAGLGSLTNASGIVGGYLRAGATGVALAVDETVATPGTYQAPSGAGHVRIGTPANMRSGWYELHFHNNLFATGAESVAISLGGATSMADLAIECQLTDAAIGAAYTRLGAPTGASVSADIAAAKSDTAAIKAKTDNLPTDPADQSLVIAATDAIIAVLGTPAGTSIADDISNVATGGADLSGIEAVTDKLDTMLATDGANYKFTADALQEAPGGSDLTALAADVTAVKAKTDNLPSDPADASVVAGLIGTAQTAVDAIKAKTDNLPSDPADASVVAGLIAGLNNISGADVLTQVNAALDAILADSIPADGTRPSIRQSLYMQHMFQFERSVSGTTVTVKKADGSTTLFTLLINSATAPTTISRAT